MFTQFKYLLQERALVPFRVCTRTSCLTFNRFAGKPAPAEGFVRSISEFVVPVALIGNENRMSLSLHTKWLTR